MKNFVLISALLLLFSCQKEDEIFTIVNLNRNNITVLGHGGMGISSTYPIDSYESIINCLNLGTDGSEIDVQMTKDSVLVAFHDSDLDTKTNLSGMISGYNYGEIKDAYYDETPYMTYSIVSLEQLFANIEDLSSYKFTFDCKLYNTDKSNDAYLGTFANAITKIAQKYNIQKRLMIESNDKNFLSLLASKNERFKLFIYPQTFEEGLATATELKLYGITISNEDISTEQMLTAHNQGFRVAVWNVETEQNNLDAIRKNPDFIQTDKVKYLVSTLSATDDAALPIVDRQRNKLDSLAHRTDSTSKVVRVNKVAVALQ
jgi:glycerophosphoryl diester phosphodiesterase